MKEDVDPVAVGDKWVDEMVEDGVADGGLSEGTEVAGDANCNSGLGGGDCGWGVFDF